MTDKDQPSVTAGRSAPVSEDKRRPRAFLPYGMLWAATIVCVIFALVELLNRS